MSSNVILYYSMMFHPCAVSDKKVTILPPDGDLTAKNALTVTTSVHLNVKSHYKDSLVCFH